MRGEAVYVHQHKDMHSGQRKMYAWMWRDYPNEPERRRQQAAKRLGAELQNLRKRRAFHAIEQLRPDPLGGLLRPRALPAELAPLGEHGLQ